MLQLHRLSRLIFAFLVYCNVVCLAVNLSPSSIPPSALFVKESSGLPKGWSLDTHKPASSNEFIAFRVALVQADPSGLEETLLRVSDPTSPTYGRYLSREAVLKFLAPANKTVSAVKYWLGSHGINTGARHSSEFSISPTHDWYTVNITIAHANRLLSTTFHAYKNSETGERILRALSYSLPRSLRDAIDTIQPTTIFRSCSTRNNAAGRKLIA
jgi:tripeptidyl-peptidase-1